MADDGVWRRDEIESPCVKICMLHPEAGVCVGCGRTGEEIAGWSAMTPEARRAVMEAAPARMKRLTSRGAVSARRRRLD